MEQIEDKNMKILCKKANPRPFCCFASKTWHLGRFSVILYVDLVHIYVLIWCRFMCRFNAYLFANIVQLYVLIWCKFICRFSTNVCPDLVQFYVAPLVINRRAIRLVYSSFVLGNNKWQLFLWIKVHLYFIVILCSTSSSSLLCLQWTWVSRLFLSWDCWMSLMT